jgi:hypothetical protein
MVSVYLNVKVEDELFRESKRYFAANSEFFRTQFALADAASTPMGQNDDNPLELEGVTVEDFESLLSVIYPM